MGDNQGNGKLDFVNQERSKYSWVPLSSVLYNMILHKSLQELSRTSISGWIHNGRAMGVSFVDILEKIDLFVTPPHCMWLVLYHECNECEILAYITIMTY